jgi:hypothetical protein
MPVVCAYSARVEKSFQTMSSREPPSRRRWRHLASLLVLGGGLVLSVLWILLLTWIVVHFAASLF